MIAPEVEKPDVTIELRNTQTPETHEIFSDSIAIEALKQILVIGVAARHGKFEAINKWSERQIDGESLQQFALEALRDAAIAGLDRLDADYQRRTPAHVAYDKLFANSAEEKHGNFLELLSQMSQNTWKLFNIEGFTLTPEKRSEFLDTEKQLANTADQEFYNFFFEPVTKGEIPENLIELTIGSEIGELYLEKKYIATNLRPSRTSHALNNNPTDPEELRFFEWMLDQELRLRLQKLGELATSEPN